MRGPFISAFLLTFLLFSTAQAEIYTTSDGHQFEVNLAPDKPEIMFGEPIYLSFEITNLSEVDLSFPEGGDYRNRLGRPESYQVKSVRTDGKAVPVPEIGMQFGGLIGTQKVAKNGGKTVIRLFLPLWSPFAEIGEYNITCDKYLYLKQSNPSKNNFDFQNGVQVSVKTKIKVVKKNNAQMAEIINFWGAEILNASTWERGQEAFRILEHIGDKRVAAPMIKAVMSGKDFAAKGEVIKFLAKFDDENSFNAIISQMNHPANSIRSDVAAALSASRNPKAFGYLMRLRDDADKFVRLAVMQGLGRKGTAESVKIVKEMLQEERNKELYEFVKFYLEKEL
jgi:hypothetical protein